MSEEQLKIALSIVQYLPAVVLLLFSVNAIKKATALIRADEVAIVHRLGRFQRILKGGLHFVVPMIDQVNDRQKIRQAIPVPKHGYVSNDRVAFEVMGVISIKIVDLKEAMYQAADFRASLQELTHQALKKEIGQMERLSVMTSKSHLTGVATSALNNVAEKWGIAITDVTIEDVRQVG